MVTATKAADLSYAEVVSSPVTVTISLAPQSPLSVQPSPTTIDIDATSALSATGGNGSGAVTYQLVSGPCSLSGSTLTGLSAGSCVVTATKAEDATYAAVTSKPTTVTVKLAPQSSLTLQASPTTIEVNGASALSTTGGNGTGAVSYQLLSGPCSLSGSTLTGIGQGSCRVTAHKAADGLYTEANATALEVPVNLIPPSALTLVVTPAHIGVGQQSTLTSTGGNGTGPVTYQLVSGPCVISGSTLTGLGAGSCTMTATQAADNVFAQGTSQPVTVTVQLLAQSALVVQANPAVIAVNGASALSATGGDGTGAVTYQLVNGPCSLTGATLTGLEAGSCTITASKAADATYAQTLSAPMSVIVGLNPQAPLALTATPDTIPVNGASTLSVSGGSGTGALSYQLFNGPCSLNGATLTGLSTGICTVTATKAAAGGFAAVTSAPVSVTILATQATGTTPGGPVTASITGGSCLGYANGSAQFTVPTGAPAGQTFPYGVFGFTALNCGVGGTVTITLTYPAALPRGAKYWKNIGGTWVDLTSKVTIAGNTVVLTLTDGGEGDTNPNPGEISDPSGPAFASGPGPQPNPIPTLSEWGQILLLFVMIGAVGWHRQAAARRTG